MRKLPWVLLSILNCIANSSVAGTTGRIFKFKVDLEDKRGSTFTILRPWDFLSERSLARRTKAGFGVTMDDLPVVNTYIMSVQGTGVKVLLASRWMNSLLISTTDSSLIHQVRDLHCVKSVSLMGVFNRKRNIAADEPEAAGEMSSLEMMESERIAVGNKVQAEDFNEGYGLGWTQISMIRAQQLHKAGFKGDGIYIAILDAGFYRANRMQAFDSIFLTKRFLGSVDLIDRGTGVFEDDDHGTQVLSCMASNVSGIMIGTAPNASYLLIRTEDAGTEVPAEEFQWLCGAEYADSCGVDLISSSLGYTEFDDVRMGHSYSELDGHTTLVTRAANMAWDRGLVIVNSAGNEGDEKWQHIGAPADADGVIAIGAVDEYGERADFSSMGPTADGRIKPDAMALGKRTTVINSNGYYIRSNGTSYSAPVFAGAMACFLQAGYYNSPATMRKIMMLSTSEFLTGDSLNGHGIPNFELAMQMVQGKNQPDSASQPFIYWPDNDSISAGFDLKSVVKPNSGYFYELKNERGKTISQGSLYCYENVLCASRITPAESGWYQLSVKDRDKLWTCRFYFARNSKKKRK